MRTPHQENKLGGFHKVDVPSVIVDDPRMKMIIISKSKDGKYYRDKQTEEKLNNSRSYNSSRHKK
jgi:hypothetical protein